MPTAFELNVERWAKHAYLILRDEVACHYQATITYSDLANRILVVSKSKQTSSHHWLGRVLSLVIKACQLRDEPPLTSLVVHKHDGMVGTAFEEVLHARGEPAPADDDAREAAAAQARLECYRHFGATIPDGGGEPAYSAIFLARQRRRGEDDREPTRQRHSRKTTAPVRETKFCPRCFIALPATGVCDNCD